MKETDIPILDLRDFKNCKKLSESFAEWGFPAPEELGYSWTTSYISSTTVPVPSQKTCPVDVYAYRRSVRYMRFG